MNKTDARAQQLFYHEFPEHYVWNDTENRWRPRRKQYKVIGRLNSVLPSEGERYYLRVLLLHRKGATSFVDLKVVQYIRFSTFREATHEMGLLTTLEMGFATNNTHANRCSSGDEIQIAFWGKSRNLLAALLTATTEETIIIVTSLLAKSFGDCIYLQATYGTKIYTDINIPEASALKNSPKKASSKRQLIEEDEKIVEIIALAREANKPFRATCVATICKVYHEEGFYYDACITCKAGVHRDFEQYWCYNCKKLIEEPTARMRIKFQIQDETGVKDVSAFEEVAKNLSDKSLDDFMNLSIEFAGHIAVRDALDEILGKKLKFEIKVADFNLDRPDFPFTVSKFYDWAEADHKKIKQEKDI